MRSGGCNPWLATHATSMAAIPCARDEGGLVQGINTDDPNKIMADTPVVGLSNVQRIATVSSAQHVLAITRDGLVKAWGWVSVWCATVHAPAQRLHLRPILPGLPVSSAQQPQHEVAWGRRGAHVHVTSRFKRGRAPCC